MGRVEIHFEDGTIVRGIATSMRTHPAETVTQRMGGFGPMSHEVEMVVEPGRLELEVRLLAGEPSSALPGKTVVRTAEPPPPANLNDEENPLWGSYA